MVYFPTLRRLVINISPRFSLDLWPGDHTAGVLRGHHKEHGEGRSPRGEPAPLHVRSDQLWEDLHHSG